MRGLALSVSIALATATGAAAQDISSSTRTHAALQQAVFVAPITSEQQPIRFELDAGDAWQAKIGGELLLDELGVRDGAHFGETGRWYLFASVSSRSVGLNMLRSEEGWSQAGWSTDQTSGLIGDAQAGLAWRRGHMQASVGYLQREIKNLHAFRGADGKKDSLVALSLSIKPGQ